MKTSYLIILFLMVCLTIHAQPNLEMKPVKLEMNIRQQLNNKYAHFKVREIDVTAFDKLNNSEKNDIQFQIPLGKDIFHLLLKHNNLRSRNFVAYTDMTPIPLDSIKSSTYKGVLQDKTNSQVRLTITEGLFEGYIKKDSEIIFIQPLWKIIKGYKNRNHIIIYKERDILNQLLKSECGVNDTSIKEFNKKSKTELNNLQNLKATTTCYFLEIISDGDYEFYQNNGNSVNLAFQSMESIFNQVEGLYESTFNIRFILNELFISTNSSSDPYTETNATELVKEIQSYWNNSLRINRPRDLVYLFTGKDNVSHKGMVLEVGTACNNKYKTYAFTSTEESDAVVNTTAHEIGHLFSAIHPSLSSSSCSPSLTIMCTDANNIGRNFAFSSYSQGQIDNHINNNDACLLEIESVFIYDIDDPICSSDELQINGLPSGSTQSWSSSTYGLVMNGNIATRNNNYNGDATVTVAGLIGDTGCSYSTSEIIAVGAPTHKPTKVDGISYTPVMRVCKWDTHTLQTSARNADNNCVSWTLPPYSTVWSSNVYGCTVEFDINPNYYNFNDPIVFTATSSNICGSNNSSFYLLVEDDCPYNSTMLIYPNPATNEINLKMEFEEDYIEKVEFYEPNGKKVKEVYSDIKNKQNSLRISTIDLAEGDYIIHIYGMGKVHKDHIVIRNSK